jgi:hypothetical protein
MPRKPEEWKVGLEIIFTPEPFTCYFSYLLVSIKELKIP